VPDAIEKKITARLKVSRLENVQTEAIGIGINKALSQILKCLARVGVAAFLRDARSQIIAKPCAWPPLQRASCTTDTDQCRRATGPIGGMVFAHAKALGYLEQNDRFFPLSRSPNFALTQRASYVTFVNCTGICGPHLQNP
jgi:hypothetical protein